MFIPHYIIENEEYTLRFRVSSQSKNLLLVYIYEKDASLGYKIPRLHKMYFNGKRDIKYMYNSVCAIIHLGWRSIKTKTIYMD